MSRTTRKASAAQSPNCNACQYFYITYDANFRYGCRALDFKSKRLPALDVLESSGLPCQLFRQKPQQP